MKRENTPLWKIEGELESWLLGTVHAGDWDADALPWPVRDALTACDLLYTETKVTPDAQARMIAHTLLPENSSLEKIVGPERFARLKEVAAEFDGSLRSDTLNRHNVWFAIMSLSMPNEGHSTALDVVVHDLALRLGLAVSPLESVREHLGVLDKFAVEEQLEILDEAMRAAPREEPFDRMIRLYKGGEMAALADLISSLDYDYSPPLKAKFQRVMLTERNQLFAERLAPALGKRKVFAAFGAAHLMGPDGMVNLLRRMGKTLTPCPVEFLS